MVHFGLRQEKSFFPYRVRLNKSLHTFIIGLFKTSIVLTLPSTCPYHCDLTYLARIVEMTPTLLFLGVKWKQQLYDRNLGVGISILKFERDCNPLNFSLLDNNLIINC